MWNLTIPTYSDNDSHFVSQGILSFKWQQYHTHTNVTVYPKKYAHGFCFAVLCCGYTLTDFPISIRLTSLALWQSNDCPSASKATLMNMDKYFMWIHYEWLRNHNKAKHNKTVCIFLGIYCILLFKLPQPSKFYIIAAGNNHHAEIDLLSTGDWTVFFCDSLTWTTNYTDGFLWTVIINPYRAANLQNMFSVFCWKNFLIINNFSVSLNLFLIRLKTVIMATSYLLWWDPLAPSGNSGEFFRYYRNRKWGRACVTTTCGREKNECFGN